MVDKRFKKGLVFAVILLFVIPGVTSAFNTDNKPDPLSYGNWLYVGGSGEGNYSKIQDAIDNATDGDTIYVFNGIYYEYLRINKKLSLIGEDKDYTKIIGNDTSNIITINTDMVTIKQFYIFTNKPYINFTNGIASYGNYTNIINNKFVNNYCAFSIEKSSYNNISNNYLNINYAEFKDSNYNTISNNYFYDISQPILQLNGCNNNNIYNNTIEGAALIIAIEMYSSTNNTLINNTITRTTDIFIDNASDCNTIIGNSFINGYPGADVDILSNGNNISSNTFINFYGLKVSGKNNIVSYNDIINNSYGINVLNSDNIIEKNYIYNNGNGIKLIGSDITVQFNIILNCNYGIYVSSNENIIRYNEFNNSGIYFYDVSGNNYIYNNNFYSLTNNNFRFQYHDGNLYYNRNYWKRPRLLPKIIFGKVGICTDDYYGYWIFIPTFVFDWRPALKPYVIPS